VASEDVEDELRAIDDPALDDPFNIPLLRRSEIVIEEEHIGIGRSCGSGDLFKFASAHQGCGIGTITALQNFANDFCARALGQGAEFCQGFFGIEFGDAGASVRFRRSGRRKRSIAGGRGLGRHGAFGRASSAGARIEPNQKGPFAVRIVPRHSRPERRTKSVTRQVAGFVAVRTSQSRKSLPSVYPSVPEALAAVAAGGVAAGAFSECTAWGTCVDATRPITTVEMACLKMSCS